MFKSLYIFFLFISLSCYSQIPEGFPVIDKKDLPGAEFKPGRHFTGESLFGYMNGGAELYREYGIENAMITEFDLNDGHYKCEIFKMTGPEEAYGIYSVSKYKCLSNPPIAEYTCQTRYQLQICKGSYYISIINKSGTSADSLISLKAGTIIAGKISEPSVNLQNFIPDYNHKDIIKHSVLVRGKLGLMNGAPVWEDYFSEITDYTAMIITTEENTTISVIINDPEEFSHFIASHGWGLCDLSVSDVKKPGGVTLRVLGDNHLLIKIEN